MGRHKIYVEPRHCKNPDCKKEFTPRLEQIRNGVGLFCSMNCSHRYKKTCWIIRLLEKILVSEKGCWEWQGAKCGGKKKGEGRYGLFNIGTELIMSHQASYLYFYGIDPRPLKLQVLHKCDNPACINPLHLFLGTHQDNMDDAVRKERMNFGEINGHTHLTSQDAKAIYHDPRGLKEIGEEYGICSASVWNIKKENTWKHVPK